VDASGGNVTYAALSLAEKLGARTIEIYGADFSYPLGMTYARGTYIFPYFEIRQNRLSPFESLFSGFLYRAPLSKKTKPGGWYYETDSLRFYRERLEEKCRSVGAEVIPEEGLGALIAVPAAAGRGLSSREGPPVFSPEKPKMKAGEFLLIYQRQIRGLPSFKKARAPAMGDLNAEERAILATLLPAAAAIRRRNPELKTAELMEETKNHCAGEIDKVLR
jgi:hypothetical protein